MDKTEHFRRLENMYRAAPVNKIYPPVITVAEGEADISIDVGPQFHHSAGGVHGSTYFKVLDDCAWFAAQSLVDDVFVLTSGFTTYITRPQADGKFIGHGKVVSATKNLIIAESVLVNEQGKEIARGNGTFMRGRFALQDAKGYPDPL